MISGEVNSPSPLTTFPCFWFLFDTDDGNDNITINYNDTNDYNYDDINIVINCTVASCIDADDESNFDNPSDRTITVNGNDTNDAWIP